MLEPQTSDAWSWSLKFQLQVHSPGTRTTTSVWIKPFWGFPLFCCIRSPGWYIPSGWVRTAWTLFIKNCFYCTCPRHTVNFCSLPARLNTWIVLDWKTLPSKATISSTTSLLSYTTNMQYPRYLPIKQSTLRLKLVTKAWNFNKMNQPVPYQEWIFDWQGLDETPTQVRAIPALGADEDDRVDWFQHVNNILIHCFPPVFVDQRQLHIELGNNRSDKKQMCSALERFCRGKPCSAPHNYQPCCSDADRQVQPHWSTNHGVHQAFVLLRHRQ